MPRRSANVVRRHRALASASEASSNRQQHFYLQLDQWAPSVSTVFQIIISVRLSAAIWSPISDCDEVYNYWEPLHFLLYGNGFQTWEYSPMYGIRSYAYIGLHYLPARLFQLVLPHTKVTTFFFIRCLLSFVSACADVLFYSSVCRKFGNGVGRLTLCFQAFGAGYFVSTAAFLPSTFAMVMTTFAYAFWMRSLDFLAVLCVAISALVGWPFAALLGAPIALDMLLVASEYSVNSKRKTQGTARWKLFFAYSLIAGVLITGALFICDTTFYGKATLAPLNIVRYNIFTPHGPDLYGTAPLSYYIVNLFLNWNFAAILSWFTLPFVAMVFWRYSGPDTLWNGRQQWLPVLWVQLAYLGWLATFFRQAHKEERFLYPVYSLLCLSAALTLDAYERLILAISWIKKTSQRLRSLLVDTPSTLCLILFALLSISRSFGQYRYYHAPFDIYMTLNEHMAATNESHPYTINVCVGKEWYRYPSSFFLPENARLRFIKSEFAGLLPKPYPEVDPANWLSVLNVTRSIPTEMNDMNKEEPSRYVDLSECHYLVDLEIDNEDLKSTYEPNYNADVRTWTVVKKEQFLMSGKSNALLRAFYVPGLSEMYCRFGNYSLLKRLHV